MTILLAVGLFAGLAFTISWATEPLWRRPGDRRRQSASGAEPAAVADAALQVDVLEQDLLEGVIAPGDFASQRQRIRYAAAAALAIAEASERTLDGLIETRVAGLSGVLEPATDSGADPWLEPSQMGSDRRTRLWFAGGAAVVVAFAGLLTGLVLLANSAGRQEAISELALADYRSLASASGSSNELILLHAGGLMRSADGGRTWQESAMRMETNTVTPVADGFLVAGNGMVWSGSDGGIVAIDIAQAGMVVPLRALASDAANPNRVAAVDSTGGMFFSQDGGFSWERLPASAPVSTSALTIMADRQLFFLSTLDQGILAGDGTTGWASANGFVNGALPTVRINDIGYDPDSGDTYEDPSGRRFRGAIYVATDVGLYKSVDAGGSWRGLGLPGDIAVLDVSAGGPAAVTVIDSRGRTYRSLDGGVTWPASE